MLLTDLDPFQSKTMSYPILVDLLKITVPQVREELKSRLTDQITQFENIWFCYVFFALFCG